MNQDEINNRKHNAHVKQQHVNKQQHQSSSVNEHAAFDHLGLTKRNADFVFRFNRDLGRADTKLSPEQKTTIVKQMVAELLAGQKTGKTAKNLYGSVQTKLQQTLHPQKKSADLNRNYWPNAIYNFLVFLALLSLMYGFAALFIKNPAARSRNGGVLTIWLSSIAIGLGMPKITTLFLPNVKYKTSGLIRLLDMIGLFSIWLIVFYGSIYLPIAINPAFPPVMNIAIGVIAVGGALYINVKYNVNSIFSNFHNRR